MSGHSGGDAGSLTLDAVRSTYEAGEAWVWLTLVDPTAEELAELRDIFGLHRLAVRHALEPQERPKLEQFSDGQWLLVLLAAHDPNDGHRVQFGDLILLLGERYVIVVHRDQCRDSLELAVRQRLHDHPELIGYGARAVLWALLDTVVAEYEPVADRFDVDITALEDLVFSDENGPDPTREIYRLREHVMGLYRAVHPLLLPLDGLLRGTPESAAIRAYVGDSVAHLLRLHDDIVAQRDRLSSVLQANVALASHRQNEIARQISGWAAIIAVPTLIASLFGTNFIDIPALHWRYGFLTMVFVSVALSVVVWAGLRRARWL